MNRFSPPSSRICSVPGRQMQWNVLDRMMSLPRDSSSQGVTPRTAACVPTGMNAGVWTCP